MSALMGSEIGASEPGDKVGNEGGMDEYDTE